MFGGKPGRVVEKAIAYCRIAIADELCQEVEEVLQRDKFKDRVNVRLVLDRFHEILRSAAFHVRLTGNLRACSDPDDNPVLECAVVAKASMIVSSDNHIRGMDPFRGIRIFTPAKFITIPI